MSLIYDALLEYHAEIVMNEAINDFVKRRLIAEIDAALQKGDQATFLRLTHQLKLLQSS